MRCPVCKANVEQGPQCRRCRADLSLLFEVYRQAEAARAQAVRLVVGGQFDEAAVELERATALHGDAADARLAAVIRLLQRDFRQAWNAYQSGRQDGAPVP